VSGRRPPQRPTLTLSVTARDAEQRLGMLLAEAACYADEIVVGVDRASSDGTWDVARCGADRVFAFVHDGVTSPLAWRARSARAASRYGWRARTPQSGRRPARKRSQRTSP
jgi:hypothetical protein